MNSTKAVTFNISHSSRLATFLAIICVGIAIASGCGSRPAGPKDRAFVSGVVTFDGKPLPVGVINFQSTERAVGTTVLIKEEGFYKSDRVPLGQNVVTIETASLQVGGISGFVAIPAKYNDPTKSGLVVDIKPGDNEDVNFVLQK